MQLKPEGAGGSSAVTFDSSALRASTYLAWRAARAMRDNGHSDRCRLRLGNLLTLGIDAEQRDAAHRKPSVASGAGD